jgi:two-component system response regulator GlrR
VVSRDAGDALAQAVHAALHAEDGFACVQVAAQGASRPERADVVVFCGGDRSCDTLRRWSSEANGGAVVVVAQDDPASIAACLNAGATDFIVAPVRPQELVARVKRASGIDPRGHTLTLPAAALPRIHGLIGRTPAFTKQLARLPMMAGCDAGVLIVGETGTGKEMFAQAIHYLSARASRPWVAVNCASIPPDLLENELFGHARGAYTHAHALRQGLVREAEGGTLFLDEIDCVPYGAQAKLLRFLQEKEFRPIGSNVVHHADVRIIAASNNDLVGLVAKGTFRQDLYFRLNVLPLVLPPLRERRDDVPELAAHFVQRFAKDLRRPVEGLTADALRRLQRHGWPGNVRELAHVVERAVLMCSGSRIDAGDLDLDGANDPADESFRAAKSRVIDEFERNYIERMLATHGGNVTHAAHAAKKNRRAFFELIRKHKIAAERFRPRT